VPMWNDARDAFCKPYPPYDPIGVLHLAGPGKRRVYHVRRTGGGRFITRVLPGASPTHPALLSAEAAAERAAVAVAA
jgi:hypothetical protein